MLKIDYKFKDESLLWLAMTHSSYANEHHGTHLQCNERLEFLGDSVLGFVTAGYLFTHYPDLPEGDLTKLRAAVVCEGALDEIAHEIGIPKPSVWGTARRWAADASVRPFRGCDRGFARRYLYGRRHRARPCVRAALHSA